ncbi:glycerol-3-phosphate dehydrogenase/oxidase [Algibacter sp. PT7-4]|uniref:glycerol-3-phosphate dehydrogenase/oxidase n=1 Tax=Algibacter ulvanivorans TaxID=3400999 RepID=UPI003AABA76C
MANFSILNRENQLKKITTNTFNIVIIGGGITGAGIALDAASRGLNVCLIEKNDFASGTSNKSTKLIHGGLRYLKQFEIGLVKESGTERAIVHKLAPHLVIPEKMLLPLIEGGNYGKLITAIGLKIYDFLADVNKEDQRIMLNKTETIKKEPLLNNKKITGGGFYSEYRTDDARLTIELLKKAASYGATILNYCELKSFEYNEHSKIKSLNCIDYNSNKVITIKAQYYISATGPWVDTLRTIDTSKNNKYLHLTKGIHLVFPFNKLPIKQSIYFDAPDGRMIFAIPRERITYVGTTDTNYNGNLDRVVTTINDTKYLLNAINNTFKNVELTINDIESNWAGLRPLIHENGKKPSELSRKDEIFISKSGLISIAGGKLTGYRKMAQRVIETVLKQMTIKEKAKFKTSFTEQIPLGSASFNSEININNYKKHIENLLLNLGVKDKYYATYLCSTYGKQTDLILNKLNTFKNTTKLECLIRAELWYCIHYEMVNALSDFFVRRTGRLYFNISSINKYLNIVANDFAMYLKWTPHKLSLEKEKLNLLIKDATTFYDKEFK